MSFLNGYQNACSVCKVEGIRKQIFHCLRYVVPTPKYSSHAPLSVIFILSSLPHPHPFKMNFTTLGINGTITEWNGTKGTLQSDNSTSKDQKFWFDKSNLVVPRYSAAYEPKIGDYVTSTALADDETRVGRVMESIRMYYPADLGADS